MGGTWLPAILGVTVAAWLSVRTYWTQQRKRNLHVLHALWEESRLVNYDCLQWSEYGDEHAVQQRIVANPAYRPFTANYSTSQVAIEALMKDMPGVDTEVVRAGFKYHYDASVTEALVRSIMSSLWRELSQEQKRAIIADIFMAVAILRKSSKRFHLLLSKELKIAETPM